MGVCAAAIIVIERCMFFGLYLYTYGHSHTLFKLLPVGFLTVLIGLLITIRDPVALVFLDEFGIGFRFIKSPLRKFDLPFSGQIFSVKEADRRISAIMKCHIIYSGSERSRTTSIQWIRVLLETPLLLDI